MKNGERPKKTTGASRAITAADYVARRKPAAFVEKEIEADTDKTVRQINRNTCVIQFKFSDADDWPFAMRDKIVDATESEAREIITKTLKNTGVKNLILDFSLLRFVSSGFLHDVLKTGLSRNIVCIGLDNSAKEQLDLTRMGLSLRQASNEKTAAAMLSSSGNRHR